ncbi:MAG: nuclear transport factor 2 family protein [Pseudomonadota bacterium]|nr:nuclear transport factor 2 family protein [Pseudomonadota bacterium]
MKKFTALRRAAFGLSMCLMATACAVSPSPRQQAATDPWLSRTLVAQEAAISRAYNSCNLHALRASLFAGTMIGMPDGRRVDPLIEARDRICAHLHREVLPGSLSVRPIGDDSALVIGMQRFCGIVGDRCSQEGSQFTHLWTLNGEGWRVRWMRRAGDPL